MGAGISIPTMTCNDCALQFRQAETNICCPRCGSVSISNLSRSVRAPSIFLTASGLVITEDALRQLVLAHIPAAAGQEGAVESLIALLQSPGVLQGDRMEGTQLLDVIARSLADGGNKQAPPASEQAWLQLKKSSWNGMHMALSQGTDSEECSICLSKYQAVIFALYIPRT